MNATTQRKRTLLAVDDDEINLMILVKNATDAGYDVRSFDDGVAAWEYLQQNPRDADIALLDKMMPGMSGMEMLARMKVHPVLKHIPVILQTGDVGIVQMREGLERGAFYYLTKPFHPEILTAILHAAANECARREELMEQMSADHGKFVALLSEAEFTLRTHAEARLIAAALAQLTAHPDDTARGLMELLDNAIEHGNLAIGYELKAKCLLDKRWLEEILQRSAMADYKDRLVRVHVQRALHTLHVTVTDEGRGFDWESYTRANAARLDKPNGRGIMVAAGALDGLRYTGSGSEVHCDLHLADQPASAQAPDSQAPGTVI
jgi:CheY-like chemotaxis protein